MRDSHRSLVNLLLGTNSSNDTNFSKQIEDTQWLTHLRLIIKVTHSLTHLLTHLLTHSLTHILTYLLTHLLTHSLTG